MLNLPDRNYYQYVVRRYLETETHKVSELPLPMIDMSLSKRFALPSYLWGLLWEDWEPDPAKGNTLFLTAYDERDENHKMEKLLGEEPENQLKRSYYAAVTPDLYLRYYQSKIQDFFKRLLGPFTRGLPMMRQYLDSYWDLYWDLHLGLSGPDVPSFAREIGASFIACLASIDVFDPEFERNYMTVRELRPQLDRWIAARLRLIEAGCPGAEATIAYYWLNNGIENKNVVFECFHNFVALSQWGNSIYGTIELLREGGDAEVRASYQQTMTDPNRNQRTREEPFSPLDRFVMELFRTIVPNSGSISTEKTNQRLNTGTVNTIHDHIKLAQSPVHWHAPDTFDPRRYLDRATSAEPNEERAQRLGLAECPFKNQSFKVKDGRDVALTNSGFGTVYSLVDGTSCPVVDDAGYSPFGFGYRRCPGELMTVAVMEDFLDQLWREQKVGAHLLELSLSQPEQVPVAPGTLVTDNIGLVQR